MKKKKYSAKNICIMAVLTAVGIILQYVENRILISPVPGGKLGLANIVTILNIFLFGGKNAMVISLLRALLGTLLSGGMTALPYSVVGTFFSVLGMILAKKYIYPKASIVGLSVIGASLYNFAQILVASLIFYTSYMFSYLPQLLIVAAVSGTVTGVGAKILGDRILKDGGIYE